MFNHNNNCLNASPEKWKYLPVSRIFHSQLDNKTTNCVIYVYLPKINCSLSELALKSINTTYNVNKSENALSSNNSVIELS